MPARTRTPQIADPADARLHDGIAALGITISTEARQALRDYLMLLAKWNAVYNLTAVREVADMLPVHLLDSLAILPLIEAEDTTTLLDVGSGAGLPGIPLAIARPRLAVTTVDAVAKKIGFQQQVKAALALTNLTAMHERVEALALAKKPTFIVSRAYAPLVDMLRSIHHLCDRSTRVIAMKGALPHDELAAISEEWVVDEVRSLEVPFLGARRCAVVLALARA